MDEEREREEWARSHVVPLSGEGGAPGAHSEGGGGDDRDDDDDDDDGYTLEHLSAVVRPVCLTMALATLVVARVRDPAGDLALSSGLNNYLVYGSGSSSGGGGGGGGGASSATQLGQAAVNALVIVCVICVATFGCVCPRGPFWRPRAPTSASPPPPLLFSLVLCYKYRCMKLMVGYLMFSSALLLGYSGGLLVATALQVGGVPWDWPSLIFIMWNFALVGVISVFWQRGVPRVVTQGYLVCVSVVMAWILSKLPEWTVWALLVALALYDLCAVLTPCGPLKALVNLAQERRDPLPGLLYEANVDEDEEEVGEEARGRQAPGGAAAGPTPQRGKEGAFVTVSPIAAAGGGGDGATASVNAAGAAAAAEEGAAAAEEEAAEPRSIKLGLGDFVFYSVLVSRAAQFDASSLAACFVTVLLGLAGTLALLSVYRKALPALPISVLAGVLVYVLTRFSIAPCLEAMALIR